MLKRTTLTSRVERLVAGARLVLAASALVAIFLDPAEPARFAGISYAILLAYTAYALVVALIAWPRITQPFLWTLGTHAIDMAFFSALIYFTEGTASPFFLYFVFALFSAALRLGILATVWTAIISIAAYIGFGMYASLVLGDPAFELNRFLVRGVYLGVIAALLTYLASYQKTVLNELSALAAWPRRIPPKLDDLVEDSLVTAAGLSRAGRLFLAWHDGAFPRLHMLTRQGSSRRVSEELGDFAEELLAIPEPETMILRFARARTVLMRSHDGAVRSANAAIIDEEFLNTFKIQSALVTWFADDRIRGALIFADYGDVTVEDIAVSEIVAGIIGARLEQFIENAQLERAAATEARMRLGRDVHDSVLQSLTGTALQLEMLKRLVDRDPASARAAAVDLQEMVMQQQRELRTFVHDIQHETWPEVDIDLSARLEALAARFRRQWDVEVLLNVDPLTRAMPAVTKHEVYSVVSEAVANAAKHAAARCIETVVKIERQDVLIEVRDDGHGFAFTGEYDLGTLNELRRGPVMLKERVASAGGRLQLMSTAAGAFVSVTLPIRKVGK